MKHGNFVDLCEAVFPAALVGCGCINPATRQQSALPLL